MLSSYNTHFILLHLYKTIEWVKSQYTDRNIDKILFFVKDGKCCVMAICCDLSFIFLCLIEVPLFVSIAMPVDSGGKDALTSVCVMTEIHW